MQEAECLKESQTLIHGKVFPASNTLEGLSIDDHLAFQVIDTNLIEIGELTWMKKS